MFSKVCLLVILFLFFFIFTAIADEYDSDELLLRLQPGVSIDTINTRYSTITTNIVVPNSVYKVRVANAQNLQIILSDMQNDVDLVWAGLTYFGETPEGSRRTLAVIDGDPTPGEYFDQQVLNKMRVAQAHEISKGAGVVVAVIDTGVDYNHPDLTSHILLDSNNAVVGYDFVSLDNDPMDETNGIDDDQDGDTDEGAGHGTHVAGIIALVAPEAKIVPIRVLDSEGNGFVDDVAAAMRWFIDPLNVPGDKKVINLSLGIPNVDEVEIIHDVINEVIEDSNLPIPVIASAGNDGLEVVHYPASEGNVFSVAAVDKADEAATFTNSKDVDFAAPGIASNNTGVGIYSTFLNGQYATWAGTSMAAPFVTGLAALIKSAESNQRNNDQLENLLETTADNIDAENPHVDLGSGRIDMFEALQEVGTAPLDVKKAIYKTQKQKLIVTARSSAGENDVLTVQGFGTMIYKPLKNKFTFNLRPVNPMPAQVTVTSSMLGTSITIDVVPKP